MGVRGSTATDPKKLNGLPVHKIYLLSLVLSAFVFGVLMYVSSEYYEKAQFSQLLSFQGPDGPGPLPINLYPKPLGVHFFGDFLIPFRLAQQSSPYLATEILPFSYLPLSSVILAPMILFGYWPALLVFLVSALSLLAIAVSRLARFLEGRISVDILFAIVFLSGPMLSNIDRGNLSLALTGVCVLAVVELRRGKPGLSAILFGLAGAMKAYPLVFFAVFIRRRDFKSLGAGVTAFAVATLAPLVMYEGGLTKNLQEMIHQFVASGTTMHASKVRAYNNSFFALLDSLGLAGDWFRINYTLVFGVIALCMVGLAMTKRATDFEALLISTVVMVFSPQTVGQYVLLLFLVPVLWLVSEEQTPGWEARIAAVLLGLLMVPKGVPFAGPQAEWSPAAITFTSTLNPLIGITLLVVCAVSILARRRSNVQVQMELDPTKGIRQDS